MLNIAQHPFFVGILVTLIFHSACTPAQEVSATTMTTPQDSSKFIAKDSIPLQTSQRLTLAFVGDLMCHSSQYQAVFEGNDTYNFIPVFEPVKPFLSSADIAVGNLETVLAGNTKNYSNYPRFNTPNAYADALKDAGFDVIVTVNNHTYDQHKDGVLRTLDELDKRKFTVLGSYRSPQAQDSLRIIEKNGFKVVILPYTQFSNIPLPHKEKYLFKLIDTTLVRNDIQKARQQGAEVVIVHYHWGAEYLPEPDAYQRQITEKTIELGADVIIGGHPHVLQPLKSYKTQANASLDSGLVAYSLGNFYSGQRKRFRHNGAILWLELEKNVSQNTKQITLKNVAHVPTWVYYGKLESKIGYRIFPAQADSIPFSPYLSLDTLTFISPASRVLLKQSRKDSDEALRKYGVNSKYVFIDEAGKIILK